MRPVSLSLIVLACLCAIPCRTQAQTTYTTLKGTCLTGKAWAGAYQRSYSLPTDTYLHQVWRAQHLTEEEAGIGRAVRDTDAAYIRDDSARHHEAILERWQLDAYWRQWRMVGTGEAAKVQLAGFMWDCWDRIYHNL